MPAPAPPTFFVITNRGQLGPFNHAGLREALGNGDVAASDQMRTPFGSPLGSVGKVLQREAQGTPTPPSVVVPPAGTGTGAPWPAIIGIGVALAAIAGGALLLWRPAQPVASADPITAQPAEAAGQPAAPEPVAVPAQPPAVEPAAPVVQPPAVPATPAKPPAKAPAKSPAKAAKPPSAPLDPYDFLLPGRTDRGWDKGKGSKVSYDGYRAFRFILEGKGSWVGSATLDRDEFKDFSGAIGILLVIDQANAGQLTCEVVEDGSRERHVSSFVLPTSGGEIRLPWTGFVRRTDKQDTPAPADDGLQLGRIRYLAFFPTDGGSVNVRVTRIALYR